MSEKEAFREELFVEICKQNEYKGIDLDTVFEKYSLEVLKNAYAKLKIAVQKEKAALTIGAYMLNCEWSDEKLNKKGKNEGKKFRNRANIEDLVEQFPEYETQIRGASEQGYAKATIINLLNCWQKNKEISIKAESAVQYWRYMNTEGKKKIVEDLLSKILNDPWYTQIYNKTRQGCANFDPAPADAEKEAFVLAIINYLSANKEQYLHYVGEEQSTFDSHVYFEKRKDEELDKRGVHKKEEK